MMTPLFSAGPGEEADEDTRKDQVERELIEREADEDFRERHHDYHDEYL